MRTNVRSALVSRWPVTSCAVLEACPVAFRLGLLRSHLFPPLLISLSAIAAWRPRWTEATAAATPGSSLTAEIASAVFSQPFAPASRSVRAPPRVHFLRTIPAASSRFQLLSFPQWVCRRPTITPERAVPAPGREDTSTSFFRAIGALDQRGPAVPFIPRRGAGPAQQLPSCWHHRSG